MAADLAGDAANRLGIGIALQPALGTGPVQQLLARQRQHRRVVRQGQAPQRARVGEERQALFAQVIPVAGIERLAADALARGPDRALAAFQAQVQRLAVMAGGTDRNRLLAPFGEL